MVDSAESEGGNPVEHESGKWQMFGRESGVDLTTFKSGLDSVFFHRMRGFLRSLRNLLLKEAESSNGLPTLLSLLFSESV